MRWQELDYYTIIKCRNSFSFFIHTYFNAKFLLHFKLFSYHEVGFMKNVSTRHLDEIDFFFRVGTFKWDPETSVFLPSLFQWPSPKKGSLESYFDDSSFNWFAIILLSEFLQWSLLKFVHAHFSIHIFKGTPH